MRVNIGTLKGKNGASIDVKFSAKDLPGADWGAGARLTAPVTVEATITNTGKCYLARGEVRTAVKLSCNRCLKEYEWPLVAHLEEEYFPATDARGHRGAPEAERQFAEESTFTGDIIDLSEAVREQAELALPYKALCVPECRGLCAVCGHNLNEGECGCQQDSIDPRLADLARLLDGTQNSSKNKSKQD